MRMTPSYVRLLVCVAGLLASTAAHAGEKKMMHCFAFTAIDSATQADWDAFYKATDALPRKMPNLVSHVWVGKLASPMRVYGAADAEAAKAFPAGNTEATATASMHRSIRQYGACFEMTESADTLKSYEAHPYHAEWMKAYEKVRVEGTTTYNILGQ